MAEGDCCCVCGGAGYGTDRPTGPQIRLKLSQNRDHEAHNDIHISRLYTCPRCYARYCSGDCYKRHGQGSECFAKFTRDAQEEVLSAIRLEKLDEGGEEAKKTMRALAHHYSEVTQTIEEDEGGNALSEDLAAALQTLEVSGDPMEALKKLCPQEQNAFFQAMDRGQLPLQVEQPWWLMTSTSGIIACLRFICYLLIKSTVSLPPLPPPAPIPLQNVSSKPPSSLLPLHLLDILFSYCATIRIFNLHSFQSWEGELGRDVKFHAVKNRIEDRCDALSCLLALSSAMSASTGNSLSVDSVAECMHMCVMRAVAASKKNNTVPKNNSLFWEVLVWADVSTLLGWKWSKIEEIAAAEQGTEGKTDDMAVGSAVQRALFDCQMLSDSALSDIQKLKKMGSAKATALQVPVRTAYVRQALRKLQFFLLYVQEGLPNSTANTRNTPCQGSDDAALLVLHMELISALSDMKERAEKLTGKINCGMMVQETIAPSGSMRNKKGKKPD